MLELSINNKVIRDRKNVCFSTCDYVSGKSLFDSR